MRIALLLGERMSVCMFIYGGGRLQLLWFGNRYLLADHITGGINSIECLIFLLLPFARVHRARDRMGLFFFRYWFLRFLSVQNWHFVRDQIAHPLKLVQPKIS